MLNFRVSANHRAMDRYAQRQSSAALALAERKCTVLRGEPSAQDPPLCAYSRCQNNKHSKR